MPGSCEIASFFCLLFAIVMIGQSLLIQRNNHSKWSWNELFFFNFFSAGLCILFYTSLTLLSWNTLFAPLNRPLALRGHVTNTSFKQRVGLLLMLEIDGAHKNYLTPEIWEKTHLRGIFYGTLIFQKTLVWFVLAAMLEGILLPSNMAAETTFYLYLVKR